MAVDSTSASKNKVTSSQTVKESKRTKSPGIRVVGSRIYDSEHGKTCHQCRQKTRDFVASCKNQKGNKQCTINFCHKCLLNRYGEKAEDMALLDDWKCPKCRCICNCSICMKKKGHKPTGQLVHTAKATGFSSVSAMLLVEEDGDFVHERKIVKDMTVSPRKTLTPKKESIAASEKNPGKENSFDGNCGSNLKPQNSTPTLKEKKSKKMKREGLKEIPNSNMDGDACLIKTPAKKLKVSEEIDEKEKSVVPKQVCEKEKLKVPKEKKLKVSEEISEVEKPKVSVGISKEEVKTSDKKEESVIPNEVSEKEKSKVSKGKKLKVLKDISVVEKPKISEGISKKEMKTSDKKEESVFLKEVSEKEKPKVSKEQKLNVSEEVSKIEEPKISGGISEKEVKTGEDGVNLVTEKKDIKTQVLKKDSFNLATKKVNGFAADIQLPQGASLTTVAGVEVTPEDAGEALQFLEFCAAFGEVLDLKKGQAEYVVRELMRGRNRRRGQYCPVVQIQIQLLSLIQEDMGEKSPSYSSTPTSGKNSWLQALKECISESKCTLNGISSDCFSRGGGGYDTLDCSKKLKVLNFLCDEALGTEALRSYIDDQNLKFVEREKEARETVTAAREKERLLKQQLKDEVAKAIIAKNGAPLSISEHEAIVSEIKTKTAQAHSEILEAMGMVSKKRKRCDAVRTAPILREDNGRAFWRLKGGGELEILVQDLGASWDAVALTEKWFVYNADEKQTFEKYISSRKH